MKKKYYWIIGILIIFAFLLGYIIGDYKPLKIGYEGLQKIESADEAISLVKTNFPEVRNITKCTGDIGCEEDISAAEIVSKKEITGWLITFWRGSGDCPSGCIWMHYYYFTVGTDSRITKLGEGSKE